MFRYRKNGIIVTLMLIGFNPGLAVIYGIIFKEFLEFSIPLREPHYLIGIINYCLKNVIKYIKLILRFPRRLIGIGTRS